MRVLSLSSLSLLPAVLLLACGVPAAEGQSTTERATLRSLDGASTEVAQVSLTAWESGLLQMQVGGAQLDRGEYTLRIYEYGTCALVREKANSPVLGTSGSRSVLPMAAVFPELELGAGPINAEAPARALRKDLDALDGRPMALENAEGQAIACGEITSTATAAR